MHTYPHYSLLSTIIALLIFAAAAYVNIISLFRNSMKKTMKRLGGQMISNQEGIFTVEGKPITIKYMAVHRYNSDFSLSTPGTFAAHLTIHTKTSQDKFYKNIGLMKEMRAQDEELNDKLYFSCDMQEFIDRLFLNTDVKPMVLDILSTMDCIQITKNACTFKQGTQNSLDDMTKGHILGIARKLLKFAPLIPKTVSTFQ